MRHRSYVKWPDTVSIGNAENESFDTHESKEAAEYICARIMREGLGGEGKIFPISTRVEPAPESTLPLLPTLVAVVNAELGLPFWPHNRPAPGQPCKHCGTRTTHKKGFCSGDCFRASKKRI